MVKNTTFDFFYYFKIKGLRLGEIENKAKVGKSFKEEILELLELNQNFEERITVLETKQEENLVDLR